MLGLKLVKPTLDLDFTNVSPQPKTSALLAIHQHREFQFAFKMHLTHTYRSVVWSKLFSKYYLWIPKVTLNQQQTNTPSRVVTKVQKYISTLSSNVSRCKVSVQLQLQSCKPRATGSLRGSRKATNPSARHHFWGLKSKSGQQSAVLENVFKSLDFNWFVQPKLQIFPTTAFSLDFRKLSWFQLRPLTGWAAGWNHFTLSNHKL